MELEKINAEYNCFNIIQELQEKESGKLKGIHISVKDCICVKSMESTAGSKMLKGYKPVFHATAIQKVLNQGATIIGKTSQDAFGFGSFAINVGKGFKQPLNPVDKTRVTGGSSGGSACITKLTNTISLAESTGGSIACPAAYCGVVGLTPTYGRVSRYGLIDYGSSLDKIGPITKTVKECAKVLEIIAGYDKKDSTSINAPVDQYTNFLNKDVKGLKIGIIKESLQEGVESEVKDAFQSTITKLKAKGVIVEETSLPLTFKYGLSVYYLIAMCEASTNLAKLCGMRYGAEDRPKGNFNEYFSKVRSENFNDESKRRIILGTFARMSGFRDAYYIKAAKIRTLIIQEYKNLFKKYDVLVSPTMPNVAPKIEDTKKLTPLENYMMDVLVCGPNLAGLPHISIPVGKQTLPVGFMIIGDHLQEGKIIQVASEVEE